MRGIILIQAIPNIFWECSLGCMMERTKIAINKPGHTRLTQNFTIFNNLLAALTSTIDSLLAKGQRIHTFESG